MTIELKITYDGTEPGLEDHRLSISSFGRPLELLLAALRRTASAIITQAIDDPAYGSKGGKLASDAKLLDLELDKIDGGCVTPTFICVARPSPSPIPGQVPIPFETLTLNLAQMAVDRLIRDIDAERSGRMCNAAARKYLFAMPAGVTTQRYTAMRDGEVFANISFSNATLAEMPAQLPRILRVSGNVTGVGFEPGASFVSLKNENARTFKCFATSEQVNSAIALRGGPVIAAILESAKTSLIWLRNADVAVRRPSVEETAQYAREEWGHTLEVLAR